MLSLDQNSCLVPQSIISAVSTVSDPAAERMGTVSADMEQSAVGDTDESRPADLDVHGQLAGAVAAERGMLHRLECEIRR